MVQNVVKFSREESAFLKGRLDLYQDADPTGAASIDASDSRRHGAAASTGKMKSGASVG